MISRAEICLIRNITGNIKERNLRFVQALLNGQGLNMIFYLR